MEKLTISDAQKNLNDIVKSVAQENKVIQIANQEQSAVLISQKNYESLQETLELLSIPGFRESIQRSIEN